MTRVYPVTIVQCKEGGFFVDIPDFSNCTEGHDIADAICMARDAIGMLGITMEDQGEALPEPNTIQSEYDGIKTLIDVDFGEYRRKNDNRMVKRNCTIPNYLNEMAEKAGLNVSAILRDALKEKLNMA